MIEYDALGRLISVCHAGAARLTSFSYDASANRTAVTTSGVSCGAPIAPNQPPDAYDDYGGQYNFGSVLFDVLDNDSDPDGDPLTITGVTCEPGCSAFIQMGRYIVLSSTGASTVEANYTISDGRGGTDSAHLSAGFLQCSGFPLIDPDGTISC